MRKPVGIGNPTTKSPPTQPVNPTIAIAPSATFVGRPVELDMHRKAFRIQPDFAMDATYKLVSGTNPWRPYGLGWNFWEKVLRHHPEGVVGELLKLGRPHGIGDMEGMEHLRWLFTWGGSYIEINGQLYAPPPVLAEAPKRSKKKLAKAG